NSWEIHTNRGVALSPAAAEAVRPRRGCPEAAQVGDVAALAGPGAGRPCRRPLGGAADVRTGGVGQTGHPVGDHVHGPVAALEPAPDLHERLGPDRDPVAL